MGSKSSIEWTEATWNPVTGCDKISPGCKFCYAERMALRLQVQERLWQRSVLPRRESLKSSGMVNLPGGPSMKSLLG